MNIKSLIIPQGVSLVKGRNGKAERGLFLAMTTIVFLIIFLFPHTVSAANYGLSIYPPLLRVHIKPGKSITEVFKIENLSSTDKTLVANIVPFSEADYFGNPILNPRTNAPWLSYFSLANSQIKLGQPFSVAAGAKEQLVLSLTVPDSAPLKDIYATLTISTYENSVDRTLEGTTIRATIGANLLVTISSQAYPATILRIENFYPTEGSFIKVGNLNFADSITPLKFTATVKNEGNFTAETKGVFRVTTKNNRPVYLEGILPVNVIAKSRRQLFNTNGSIFEFNPSLSQIGFHQIALEIKTDNSNTTGTIEIFFFPLKLALGLLLSLVIVVSLVKITAQPPLDITTEQ